MKYKNVLCPLYKVFPSVSGFYGLEPEPTGSATLFMFFHKFTRTPIAEDSGPDQFVGSMYIKGTAPDPDPQYVIDTDPIVSLNYYSR